MIYYDDIQDATPKLYNKKGSKNNPATVYSDNIYSFDIEVSNLFKINGVWQNFDYSKPKEYYQSIPMMGLPYIWQFGINNQVYYGRDLCEFTEVLEKISDEYVRKILWVHNLSYETEFLIQLFKSKGWTIEKMLCRDLHKPITYYIPEINIEFRCTYMLTNMSLAKAAEEFTDIAKKKTLDYDAKVRTPLTTLRPEEMEYCEYDILCVYEIVKTFMQRYKNHVAEIPYTSTGEVRRRIREALDYRHVLKMQKLVPDAGNYMMLWSVFSGGYTHANILASGHVQKNGHQQDIASSYPEHLLSKLPSTPFMRCMKSDFNKEPDKFGYIAYVHFKGVRSKYYTTYMQTAKCIFDDDKEKRKDQMRHLTTDNGRVIMSKEHYMWVTNIDMDIINKVYNIDEIEVIKCYRSHLAYLDLRIIKLVLELYGNKTKLKGVKGKEAVYKRDKSNLNSLY